MSSQLPLLAWLAISACSVAVHPARLSRKACLWFLGSVLAAEAKKAEFVRFASPVLGERALRTVSSATGERLRSGYAPSPHRKCC
eukprot:2896182-Pleurochrysis_carterae.AAC.3